MRFITLNSITHDAKILLTAHTLGIKTQTKYDHCGQVLLVYWGEYLNKDTQV